MHPPQKNIGENSDFKQFKIKSNYKKTGSIKNNVKILRKSKFKELEELDEEEYQID